jgi:hypothetical protein
VDALGAAASTDSVSFSIQSDWWNIAAGKTAPEKYVKFTGPPMIDLLLERLSFRLSTADQVELRLLKAEFEALPARGADSSGETRLRHTIRPAELEPKASLYP